MNLNAYEQIMAHRAQVETETPGFVETSTGDRRPAANVKVLSQLEDETALNILRAAMPVADALRRFIDYAERQIDGFRDLATQEHQVKWRSQVGNRSVQSRDGLVRIVVSMGCLYQIDPSVQDAYALVMSCADRWGDGAAQAANIKSLAVSAFTPTEGGRLSRSRLGFLLDYEPVEPDEEWARAIKIIQDAIHIASRKQALRVQWRPNQQAAWQTVPLSTQAAEAVPAARKGAQPQEAA